MDLTGKIKNLAVDYFSKKITVTLEINEAERFIKGVDELKKLEKLSIIIKPFRRKRSLSANAYFHVLITKIAEKVGTSKAEAKNLMIGRYGQPELIKGNIAVLKTNVPTDIMYKKEDVHTVAIGRRLEKGKEVVFYRLMRGSHTYDSREMSELIKGTIQEAEDLGIETLTPRELEQILEKWKPRKQAEKYGFTVYLCLNHHTNGGEAVHRNPNGPLDRYLKELAQKYWEENNGTREEFIKTFGRNYL